MKYKEFKQSSNKHLHTCECLLNNLENKTCENEQSLINNIHYLSGYIIEMALKYKIYRNSNYDINRNITNFPNYNQTIKHHNLNTLFNQCSISISLDNNFIKNNQWNVQQRYEMNKNISLQDVKDFLSEAKKCYKECTCY